MPKEAQKKVLNIMPYGFYIVGVAGSDGEANGFTANWISQVSFGPPQVTVAVHKDHHSRDLIQSGGVFSVNFLDNTQEDLARTFAQHQEAGEDSVAGARFGRGPDTGAPLFEDAFAHLECQVVNQMEAGDHTVYLGEVVSANHGREANILTSPETSLHYDKAWHLSNRVSYDFVLSTSEK